MLSISSQFHFAADLVAMLVAAAGVVMVTLRPDLTRERVPARLAMIAGFVAFGGTAFVIGARLATGTAPTTLGVVLAAGAAGVALGATGWRAGRRSRRTLAVGAVVGAAAGVAQAASAPTDQVDVALAVGSVLVGLALLGAGRRSIATRVAANAAGTLLLVVLVLAVALSSVISRSVQQQALVASRDRTALQAGQLLNGSADALLTSRVVAADLERVFRPDPGGRGGLGSARVATAAIGARLRTLASFYPAGALVFVTAGGTQVSSAAVPTGLAGLPVAAGLSCRSGAPGSTGRRTIAVLDGTAYALGAFPACAASPLHRVGTVLVAEAIRSASLAGLRADAGQSLAVVGPTGPVATVGSLRRATITSAASRASATGATSRLEGGRFVASAPLQVAGNDPVVSLVVSDSAAALSATTDSLDRTLLLIALGGTLLALVLAALTGDRITSGLRQLTSAARDIRSGGVSVRAGSVSRDEVGVLAGAFDAMVDSVEEKNAALQAAAVDEGRLRARLEAVVAGMNEALIAVDPDGRVTDFNHAAVELTGLATDGVIGRRAVDVLAFAGEEGSRVAASLDRGGEPWTGLARVVTAAGREVPVAVSSGPLHDPLGEDRGLVMVLRDLRAEEQVERMKTEFLSRVGHELRTPLTGILGYADILSRREVPPPQARVWHQEILQAAKRQLRIVQLLEFFASAGAGRMVLTAESVDVAGLVGTVVEGWQSRLPDEHRLETDVADSLPPVRADRRWTTLALDELLDNSVKFSPDGGTIEVRAAAVDRPDGGHGVEITVTDHGVGMAPDELERAFGAFEQGDPSDTRSYGGLGLGLSAVTRIVAELGGSVRCSSAVGHGTTMSVLLPVEEP